MENAASIFTMSLRGVIMDSTYLSPSEKTLSTILRSTGWTSPPASASSTRDFISRSVTLLLTWLMPMSFRTAVLDLLRIHTNGAVAFESSVMGAATSFATLSGAASPILFGTSSPNISVRYVAASTTVPCATSVAHFCGTPAEARHSPNLPAIASPE